MMATTSPTSTAYAASMPMARPRLAACLGWLERVPLSLHLFLFRLAIVGVFLRAGLQKLGSWESTVALFAEEYKVPVLPPAIAAAMGSAVEVGCSLVESYSIGWPPISMRILTPSIFCSMSQLSPSCLRGVHLNQKVCSCFWVTLLFMTSIVCEVLVVIFW